MKHKTFQKQTTRPGGDDNARHASLVQPRPFAQPAPPQQLAPAAPLRQQDGPSASEGHHFGRVAVRPRAAAHGRPVGGGLPDKLRAGIEKMSGVSLADVRVHYDSSRPARLKALAYTQGPEIHVAAGQEQHLAHEAWHVVQQKQGRVRATARRGGAGVNTSAALEREADRMGARAQRVAPGPATAARNVSHVAAASGARGAAPIQAKWILRGDKPVEVPDNHALQPGESHISSSINRPHRHARRLSASGLYLPRYVAPQVPLQPQNAVPQLVGVPKVGNVPQDDQLLDAPPQLDLSQLHQPQVNLQQNVLQQNDLQQIAPIQDDQPRIDQPRIDQPRIDLQPNNSPPIIVSNDNLPRNDVRGSDSVSSQSGPSIKPIDLSNQPPRESPRRKQVLDLSNQPSSSSSSSDSDRKPSPRQFPVSQPRQPINLLGKNQYQGLVEESSSSDLDDDLLSRSQSSVRQSSQSINFLEDDRNQLNERSSLVRNSGSRRGSYMALNDDAPLNGPQQPGVGQQLLSGGEQFLTANSPGIYTGPGGGGLATASNAMAFGQSWQQNWSVNSINNPSSTVNTLGQTGSAVSGVGDLAAIGRSAYTIHNARQVLNDPNATRPQKALAYSQIKSGAMDVATQSVDTGSQTANLVSSFAQHGSAVATHAGQVAPFLAAPVSAVVGTRALWRGGRALMHEGNLAALDKRGMSEGMRRAAKFSEKQMGKRKRRNLLGAAGAALGVGGSLALGLGALGVGAAMATPIGWGLAAAGGAVALGIGAYKLARWAWKKYKGTSGVKREQHANALHQAITNGQEGEADHDHAKQILTARGIDVEDVRGTGGKDFLKRKLESW